MRKIGTAREICDLIARDPWQIEVLRAVEKLKLPDWWIGAGFVRNKVWDCIFEKSDARPPDIDIACFSFDIDVKQEENFQKELERVMPDLEWSVTNQKRMAEIHGDPPYKDAADGIAHWPETATAVGVRLEKGRLELTAPHGIEDLINGIVRPTPAFKNRAKQFAERQQKKNWIAIWPQLRFEF